MESRLFRKKSIDRVASPEQLHDYIRVTSPSVWLIMSAIVFLLVGICVWAVFGRLETKIPVCAVTENDRMVCYIKESQRDLVSGQMQVLLPEGSCTILEISQQPRLVDDSFPDYLLHVGGFSRGEWVYTAVLSQEPGDSGRIYEAQIVTESIAPMTFIVN